MKPTYRDGPKLPNPSSQHQGITVAIRLVRKYRTRIPTADELCREFGMSRATAYRWVAALRDDHQSRVQRGTS
ncbi:hypothetical protein D3C81_1049670 [compost metagenome]